MKKIGCSGKKRIWCKKHSTDPFLEISKIFSLPVLIKAEYHETNGDCCRYICTKFPESAIEKLKAGILTALRS